MGSFLTRGIILSYVNNIATRTWRTDKKTPVKAKKKEKAKYLVGVGEGMAIDTVVGGVQLTVEEPGGVAVVESAVLNGVEGL